MGAGRGRRAARGRRAGARADLGDRAPARPTARCTPAATPACCSRATTAARAGSSTAALWEHPTRPDWQPGGGGLCLHSIVHLAGRSGPAGASRVSAAGMWLTEDGGATLARAATRGSRPRYLPEEAPEDDDRAAACTTSSARRAARSGCSCSSTAASTAPTTPARAGPTSARRPAVGLRLPAGASTRPTPTART